MVTSRTGLDCSQWGCQDLLRGEQKLYMKIICRVIKLREIIQTSNLDIVRYCQGQFCFELPSVILARRMTKFEAKFSNFLSNKYK